MSAIKPRRSLTFEEKLQIIQRLEKGESVTALGKVFNVAQSTISRCKGKKTEIVNFASKLTTHEEGSKKLKYMRKPKYDQIDRAIYLWYMRRRKEGHITTGPILCEKALELYNKLGGPPDFKASTGWLKTFKSRHGIRQLATLGESSVTVVNTFEDTFLDILTKEGYSLEDVYNAEETCLSWKSLPWKCRQISPEEQITIMVTANATGSHSLPLLLIGQSETPPCFQNEPCLPVIYKTHEDACMSMDIFQHWYANNFIQQVKKLKEVKNKTGKVLLLLANAPYHPEADVLNSVDENFKVMYLPQNVTALVQPMDQGIIEKMKISYKKRLLRRLLLAKDERNVLQFVEQFNLKNCCDMLADVWSSFSQIELKRAWDKLLNEKEVKGSDVDNSAEVNDMVNMFHVIPGFSDCNESDARMWLENDNALDVPCMDDDEIASFVHDDQEVMSDEDEDQEDQELAKRGPSHGDAYAALQIAMTWYEQQEGCCPKELEMLKDMRDLAARKM